MMFADLLDPDHLAAVYDDYLATGRERFLAEVERTKAPAGSARPATGGRR